MVHQGLPSSAYDSSCDGTWLLLKNIYEMRVWDSTNNDYENSDIHSYLNNAFLNLFDSDIVSIIKQVKIPYTKGTGQGGTVNTGSNGLATRVFLISMSEMDFERYDVNVEGAALSYFKGTGYTKTTATYNGTKTNWWLRSLYKGRTNQVCVISSGGGYTSYMNSYAQGVRPAMILPYEANVDDSGMIVASSGAIGGEVNINGVTYELTGEGYVNINGVLCPLDDSGVNIGGILNSMGG